MIEALAHHTNFEHFDTPEYAIGPLLQYLPAEATIWECTDTYGKSGIASGLKKHGWKVETSGIPELDFLANDVTGWDIIVTNPPYRQKDAFIRKCIDYDKPFALLLPLTALEGIKRGNMWREIEYEFGLLVLDRRVEFTGGGVWFNTSWFTRGLFTGVRFEEL